MALLILSRACRLVRDADCGASGSPAYHGSHVPATTVHAVYLAEQGKGALRNGEKVQVTPEPKLNKVLCAFGFDSAPQRRTRQDIKLLFRISRAVRNTRATNSLVDFCFTVDGRLGACVNLKTRIWDIAPVAVILPEAEGKLTYVDGTPISFELDAKVADRNYAVLGASANLHAQLATLTRTARQR